MNKKNVVVVESGITAPQMQDFWRKVGDGSIDGKKFQQFLEKPHLFNVEKMVTVTLVRAINILGQGKVITAKQAAKVRRMKVPKGASIRHGEATLLQCAQENQQGKADWRIIYCFGKSLRELREIYGADQNKQPCFYKDSAWWLKSEEDDWATKKMEPGYYLINCLGQFSNMTWDQQETEIAKLGDKYERCHEATFSEAILTIFMVNNGERIAKDWYHWGVSAASNGNHVNVGTLDAVGLIVFINWYDDCIQDLRVSVARKFDY